MQQQKPSSMQLGLLSIKLLYKKLIRELEGVEDYVPIIEDQINKIEQYEQNIEDITFEHFRFLLQQKHQQHKNIQKGLISISKLDFRDFKEIKEIKEIKQITPNKIIQEKLNFQDLYLENRYYNTDIQYYKDNQHSCTFRINNQPETVIIGFGICETTQKKNKTIDGSHSLFQNKQFGILDQKDIKFSKTEFKFKKGDYINVTVSPNIDDDISPKVFQIQWTNLKTQQQFEFHPWTLFLGEWKFCAVVNHVFVGKIFEIK